MSILDVVLLACLAALIIFAALMIHINRSMRAQSRDVRSEKQKLEERATSVMLDLTRTDSALESERIQGGQLRDEIQRLRHECDDARSTVERLKLERIELLTHAEYAAMEKSAMQSAFKIASHEVMRDIIEDFSKKAGENQAQYEAISRQRVDAQMQPIAEALDRFQQQVSSLERSRASDQGGLKEQITALMQASLETQNEAKRLSGALKRGAGAQGRWGEQTLRNVLEHAGLQARYDYDEQVNLETEEGRKRPDVVLRLPRGGVFAIDAKCSLTAFLEAQEASESARTLALQRHASSIRSHMLSLSGQEYWSQFGDRGTPDFVAMFVPGDGFLAAALECMPDLLSQGMSKRVIIVTPTTLFALCKAVALGWRVEEQSKNAEEVVKLGKELHKRISVMGSHLSAMGKSLGNTVSKYNDFVGSLEASVMTQARRFEVLKVDHEAKSIPEMTAVELGVRPLAKLSTAEPTQS